MKMQEQMTYNSDDILRMAKEALDDSSMYLLHIASILSESSKQLQAGNDQQGMMNFARGVSDLDQFFKLMEQIGIAAQPQCTKQIDAFKNGILETVRNMDRALISQNYVAVSDEISGSLIPKFPAWSSVVEEFNAGLQAQAE